MLKNPQIRGIKKRGFKAYYCYDESPRDEDDKVDEIFKHIRL